VVWFHLRPYYRNNVLEYIEERADIVQTQVNYVFWDELDAKDPYRSMASKLLFHPGYCPVAIRTQMIIERMQKGDGIIAFYPKSCRHFHSSARIEAELFKNAGIPFLIIDGDCIDSRGDDFLVLKTRIDRFLKSLQSHTRNTISSTSTAV
jgi:benzoyl-CoA reductase/2-hydroxyglutaryl-CoA dehydratase subunit BcrC/BadD/HgdB